MNPKQELSRLIDREIVTYIREMQQLGPGQGVAIGGPAAAVGQGPQIARQAPACVERCAKTGDRLATDQRLEPQKRGHRPDLVTGRDQRQGISAARHYIGQPGQISVGNLTWSQAAFHIWMWLVDQPRAGVGLGGGGQQTKIGANRPRPQPD